MPALSASLTFLCPITTGSSILRTRLSLISASYRTTNHLRRFYAMKMAQATSINALVEPQWLVDNLEKVTVLDASWYMPSSSRDAAAEFEEARIPGPSASRPPSVRHSQFIC